MIQAERVSELQDMVLRNDNIDAGKLTDEEIKIVRSCQERIDMYMNELIKLMMQKR